MSNLGGETPLGEITKAPLWELFAAYDKLPKRIKELYDSMPINADPREFLQAAETYGESQAYWMLYNLVDKNFPGWAGGVERLRK